mgnify:CR=1 FL=1
MDHITLHSADFDKPGLTGNLFQPLTPGLLWTNPASSTYPFWPQRPTTGMSGISEFNNLGLAIKNLTRLARINLANIGPDYPAIDPATGLYPTDAASQLQVTTATNSRKLLANQVLDGLCAATGTPDMRATPDLANPQYKAWVWLAQLAVNIVDFVDPDDVMTVLDLSPNSAPGTGRKVYGTELPKVVLNEIYAQADNSTADYNKTSGNANDDYTVSVFLELLNPTPSSVAPNATNVNRPNDAYLQVVGSGMGATTQTVYQVELAKTAPPALTDPFATNAMGQADLGGVVGFSSSPHTFSGTSSSISTWKDASGNDATPLGLSPAGNSFAATNPKTGAEGFLWVGPKVTDNIRDTLDATFAPLEQPNLRYTWPNNSTTAPEATILLRRLANPGLAPDPNNNPYVLVDYATLKPEMVQDARKRTNSGNNTAVVAINTRKSFGRRQPYGGQDIKDASSTSRNLGAYVESAKTNTNAPLHTFGQLNFTNQPAAYAPTTGTDGETPDWLVHYDRQLVSPAGLLLVSTYRPHELTQKFLLVDPTTKKTTAAHQHASAWMDEQTGLHRFLELVQCHGEYAMSDGTNLVKLLPSGGRMQGRVNLNTTPISSDGSFSPVLDALFDTNSANPNTASHFSPTDVRNLAAMLAQDRAAGNYITGLNAANRMGSLYAMSTTAPAPPTNTDPWDQTYKLKWDPYANNVAATPNGAAIRAQSNSVHPLVRLEMLDKILNQTTLRSNVFGIWLTVGFFEVTDSTTVPVKLGGEIGAAAGRQTRYKLFSLVDRTRIKAFETKATAAISSQIDSATGDYQFNLIPINHSQPFVDASNNPTSIEPRTGKTVSLLSLAQSQPLVLTIDPDTINEETVEAVFTNNQLYAQIRRNHNAGAKIISRGNPGPMKDYKVNDDTEVVFYWTILE